jgi:FixJ family two-component response regulator
MNLASFREFTQYEAVAPVTEAILVIDDDPDWLAECEFMLQMLGYRPLCASTRDEAMRLIRSEEILTVITDYSMPGCNGLTLMEDLLALAALDGRSLRFILATGHASLEVAVAAIRAHVSDFLEKPIAHDQLSKALLRARGITLEGQAKTTLVDHLGSLSQELQRISQLIAPKDAAPGGRAGCLQPAKTAEPMFIRRLLREESKRRQIGNGELFGDPCWSMLLDLMIAKLEGRKVAVSSACIASGAPTTTAMRLINRLVGESILVRSPDEKDGRRDFLTIDPAIEAPLIAYLNELAKAE